MGFFLLSSHLLCFGITLYSSWLPWYWSPEVVPSLLVRWEGELEHSAVRWESELEHAALAAAYSCP